MFPLALPRRQDNGKRPPLSIENYDSGCFKSALQQYLISISAPNGLDVFCSS